MHNVPTDFIRSRAIRLVNSVTPVARPVNGISVAVLGGVMVGLSTKLDGSSFTIGGTDGLDVILIDPALQGLKLTIVTQNSLIGPLVNLRSDDVGLSVAGTAISSDGVWERLPCKVDIADVPVLLEVVKRNPNGFRNFSLGSIVALAVAGGGLMLNPSAPPLQNVGGVPSSDQSSSIVRADTTELTNMIEDAGLAQYLTVSSGSDGTLQVSGSIPRAFEETWRELRIAWDSIDGAPLLMGSVEEIQALQELPAVTAVNLAEVPYILLSSGRSVYVGDDLTEGWIVTEIGRAGISLARSGEQVEIAY